MHQVPSRRQVRGVLLVLAVVLGVVAPVGSAGAATAPVANGVTADAGAPDHGPADARALEAAVVGLAATPSGEGYWQVAGDGGVFSFGDARFHGSAGDIDLNRPIVGMAALPSGGGYWLVARDGGVFAYGDARFHGSTGGQRLNQPIVGMAPTPSGKGYWLVARDGGVFSFGDARFFGSTGDRALNEPIVGMAASPSGHGYWLVARDGGVFSFGDARFQGSTGDRQLDQPVVGLAAAPGSGYWLAARDGRIFGFGVEGRTEGGADVNTAPVVAIAARPGGGYWLAHGEAGPSWQRGSVFPEHRLVAFYGSPASPALGVLGQGSPAQAARRLLDQAGAYEAGERPVIPAFELIATIALAAPGSRGLYNNPMSIDEVRRYLDAVRAIDGMLVLDIQPGRGDFLTEAKRYEEVLREPDVGLALDPEWSVGPGQRPGGGRIGSVDASDINRVSAYLSELVARHGLPEKLLVVHRFTPGMVTNAGQVVARPGVEMVFHADGFGTPEAKLADYRTLLPDRFARGLKIFYEQDIGRLAPSEVLAIEPPVDVVTYQ